MTDYTALSDLELTGLLGSGDHAAYAALYQRYHVLLYVYAYKKLRDKEAAKDLVQEIFLSLWQKRDTHTLSTSLAGYLYRSVRNKAFDLFAHQQVTQQYLDSLQHFLDVDPSRTDDLVREKEIEALIDAEIALLPKGMREVFTLSRKQYLSHSEIAEKLNMTQPAVSKQIKRALKILKPRLGSDIYILLCISYLTGAPHSTEKKAAPQSTQNVPLHQS